MSEGITKHSQTVAGSRPGSPGRPAGKIRLEAYCHEMVEKEVKLSGTCGRVYLPREWVGRRVKIIRQD